MKALGKRGSSRDKSNTAKVTKKSKANVQVDSLTNKQKSVLAEAAAILQVPVTCLPITLKSLLGPAANIESQVKKAKHTSFTESDSLFDVNEFLSSQERGRNSDGSNRQAIELSAGDIFTSPEELRNSVASSYQFVESSNPDLFLDSNHYFGFSMAPTSSQWAECFQNLFPFDCDPFTNGGGSFAAEKSPLLPLGFGLNEASQHTAAGAEDLTRSFFACDEDIAASQYLSPSSLVLTQITHPPNQRPTMTYPDEKRLLGWNEPLELDEENGCYEALPISLPKGKSTRSSGSGSADPQDVDERQSMEKSGPTRRGPFQSERHRKETAQTRKLTACLRCRMQRIRCIPNPSDLRGVCLTCQAVSTLKFARLPCLRYKITDVKLFAVGHSVAGFERTCRWKNMELDDITLWESMEVKRIKVTQGLISNPLTLSVRRFIPLEGDMIHKTWNVGDVKKKLPFLTYAIASFQEAIQSFARWINDEGTHYFDALLNSGPSQKLIRKTYSMAILTFSNAKTEAERKLLKMVLRLWVAIHMTTNSEQIVGEETLGMKCDIMDETSHMHGKIPIPPVMTAQISLMLSQGIQLPLRRHVLDELQKIISANKPSNWFTIYLTIFILLHNCTLITEHDCKFIKAYGLKRQFARASTVAEFHAGAKILLGHFHYCNKGFQPFSPEWNPAESATIAELSDDQIHFIRETADYVKQNEDHFNEILRRCSYYDDYYFVAQLYDEEWKPRYTV